MAIRDHLRTGSGRAILDQFASVGEELAGPLARHPAAPTAVRTIARLGDRNPTRRRCEVELVVVDGPGVRGRIAAMVNPRLTDDDGNPIGLLGFFACDRSPDVARWLFDRGMSWLQAQGCTVARGPIDFSTWHDYRFVTTAETGEWIPGEPFHPGHYPELWLQDDFAPVSSYSTDWLGDIDGLIDGFAARAQSCRDAGYTLRSISPQDMEAIHALSRAAFAGAWMYSDIALDELAALYGPETVRALGSGSFLAVAPDGDPVGFLYAFDMPLAGRQASVCKTVAVAPAHRKARIYPLLMHAWMSGRRDAGVRDLVGALMHADGDPANMGWITPETTIKEYQLYERRL